MKNKLSGLIVFFIVLFLLNGCSVKKTVVSMEQEYIHSWGIFTRYDKEKIKSLLDDKQSMPVEMIGWSKKGLFAYRYRNISGECTFVIINTITNEIIERDYVIMGEDYVGIYGGSSVSFCYFNEDGTFNTKGLTAKWNTLNDFIEDYRIKWNTLLEKNHIIGKIADPFSENFQNTLLEFPIDNNSCWFDYVTNNDYNYFDYVIERKKERDIFYWKLIIGNSTVQKIIGKEDVKPSLIEFLIGRKIRGYYKSPYENKIAVVVNCYRCISYPEKNITYGTLNLFGCNMDEIGLSQ
jgi:hypothetical protein